MGKLFSTNRLIDRIFFAMLVPTILMNLTTALASFADTVIVGNFLDELALSSVTFATPVYMLINTFAALFAVGGSTAMGIDAGRGEKAAANRVYSLSLIHIWRGIPAQTAAGARAYRSRGEAV